MSMDRCAECSRLVDTDDDPDCYVETVNTSPHPIMKHWVMHKCICEACRDKEEATNE